MTPAAVIVTDWLKEPVRGLPAGQGRLEVVSAHSSEIGPDLWRRTEVLYTFNVLPTPEQAPDLRWVQLFTAGADHALNSPLARLPIVFTSVSGVHAVPMAEYALAMLLAWYHHVPALLDWQRGGQWPPEPERMTRFVPRAELWGQTMGIVGYGSVGRHIARIAVRFGMRVLAMRRTRDRRDEGFTLPGAGDPEGQFPERFYATEDLLPMLGACDVVVLCLPLTEQTRGSFDSGTLRAIKPGGVLLNLARGGIVDEDALCATLDDGHLDAAILDVFAAEPLPSESPLWHHPKVLMSPHVSGHSRRYEERANLVFAENLHRYLTGQPLLNAVDRTLGY